MRGKPFEPGNKAGKGRRRPPHITAQFVSCTPLDSDPRAIGFLELDRYPTST
jgi:hypothetical protein